MCYYDMHKMNYLYQNEINVLIISEYLTTNQFRMACSKSCGENTREEIKVLTWNTIISNTVSGGPVV